MKLATTNYSLLFLSYPPTSFAVLYSFPTFSFSSTFSQSSRHGRQGSSSISMHSWRNFCSKWVLAKTQTVCIPAQPELPFYLLIVEMGRSQVPEAAACTLTYYSMAEMKGRPQRNTLSLLPEDLLRNPVATPENTSVSPKFTTSRVILVF